MLNFKMYLSGSTKDKKQIFRLALPQWVIGVLLIALILTKSENGLAEPSMSLIVVSGMSETSVDPNLLVLQIETWGKSAVAATAQELQAKQASHVKQVVEKYKVKKEDLTSESYSLSPEVVWDQKTQQQKVTGYRAVQVLTIKLRQIAQAGHVIDELGSVSKSDMSAGVSIQSTKWDFDGKDAVESSILLEAVRHARLKAEGLAKAAAVKIKGVHRILHNPEHPLAVPLEASALMQDKSFARGKSQSTELNAGKIKLKVDVLMEFEIQPL